MLLKWCKPQFGLWNPSYDFSFSHLCCLSICCQQCPLRHCSAHTCTYSHTYTALKVAIFACYTWTPLVVQLTQTKLTALLLPLALLWRPRPLFPSLQRSRGTPSCCCRLLELPSLLLFLFALFCLLFFFLPNPVSRFLKQQSIAFLFLFFFIFSCLICCWHTVPYNW